MKMKIIEEIYLGMVEWGSREAGAYTANFPRCSYTTHSHQY